MNARIAVATKLGVREQARRPLLLILLAACAPWIYGDEPAPAPVAQTLRVAAVQMRSRSNSGNDRALHADSMVC